MGQTPLRFLLILLLIIPTPHLFSQSQTSNHNSQDLTSDQIFRPPMADQSEPASRIRYGGKYLDFGLALPLAFYTSEGRHSTWQVGFLGGIAAGFGSVRASLYLRAADFEHISGFQPFHYSREVAEWLLAYDAPHHVRIYGCPRVLVRTYPSVGRWTFQAGTEWFPVPLSSRRWRFYLADDFQTRGEVGWRTNISVEPGVQWTTRKGEPVARLEAWFYSGQVPFGELFQRRERVLGAQLIFTLEPVVKSLIIHRH